MSGASEHRILLDLEQSNNERLRVTVSPFKDRDYYHIEQIGPVTEALQKAHGG